MELFFHDKFYYFKKYFACLLLQGDSPRNGIQEKIIVKSKQQKVNCKRQKKIQ